MCGICGKIRNDGQPVLEDLVRKMTSVLAHRGPDDDGIYIKRCDTAANASATVGLGHRRLSIIDLSPAGQQPMSNEDGKVWVVFNGEIYNFRSLREELENKGHQFKSHADSEVVIHLYEEEGIAAVKKLIGMFAIALWDDEKETLYLCRDGVGIKPLVYSRQGGVLVFASEIKAILQDPEVSRDIDWEALSLYLTLNYIPAPYTIFKSIRKLRPGYVLSWRKGVTVETPFWDLEAAVIPESGGNIETTKQELFRAMEEAVKMQMVADVPVGAFLSGGIDSSIIVGLMARHSRRPVKTYTIGYKDMPLFDETDYARVVAEFNGTDHREFRLGVDDILDAVPKVLEAQDEPFGDSSAVPVYIVARETAREVKVALSGDGGDELFAGYRMYRGESLYAKYRLIPSWIRRMIIMPFCKMLPDSRDAWMSDRIRIVKKFVNGAKDTLAERFMAWNEIFSRELRRELLSPAGARVRDHNLGLGLASARLAEWSGDSLNRMLYTDFKESLPGDMLRKVDAMSMANSLEVRVPILDPKVCGLAFAIDGGLKIRKGRGKYILIETFKDILPRKLHNRPKSGFEMPIGKWLKTDLKFLLDEYLSKDIVERQGLFNYTVIDRLISALADNRYDTSWQLWNLIAFQVWYGRYGKT